MDNDAEDRELLARWGVADPTSPRARRIIAVAKLQRDLNDLCDRINVDGCWGPLSQEQLDKLPSFFPHDQALVLKLVDEANAAIEVERQGGAPVIRRPPRF